MKTKNKVTFEESRLLGKKPKVAAETTSETPESPTDKALKFISKINEYQAVEGGDNPASILENNPYKDALLAFTEDLDAESYEFTGVEYKPGQLILKYPKGPLTIEKELFAAIFWKEIAKKLEEVLKGKNVSSELMALAASQNSPKFDALVFAVAAGAKNIDKIVTDEALVELENLRPALNPEASGARAKAKGSVERAQLRESLPKKAPVKLPTAPVLSKKQFIEKVDDRSEQNALDRLKINVNREDLQIDARQWDHSTLEGLQKIYADCQNLEIFNHNPDFYKTMFAILRNGADKGTNPYLANDNYRKMFQTPANHMRELEGLAPQGGFWGGDQYAKAYGHLQYLQGLLLTQDNYQVETLGKQSNLDSDPVATKVTGFVRDNLSKFQKAIKERDYATAGLYAVGIFAIYKSIQKLGGGGDGHGGHGKGNMMKWLAYGAAIYAGNTFLKNAGYDILKMTGFRDPDYEVKGTPMEVMRNILHSNPSLRETTKDIDYGIVLRISDVKLTSLQDLLKKSNDSGVQFIHPYEFSDIFPDVAKVWPFDMGIGEKGLSDYTGMSNVKLSPNQKEYVRVGQQLYKIALGLQGVYDETLRKDHPLYKGIPYEQAIQGDGTRKLGKVRHLLDAVSPYSVRTPDKLSRLKRIDVQSKLEELFKTRKAAGLTVEEPTSPGHYPGKLMGFPIVVVLDEDKKNYRLYLRNNYGGKEKPGNQFTEIPFEGPNSTIRAEEAVEAVKNRILELVKPLNQAGGRALLTDTLYYDDGWKCKVKLPEVKEFDIRDTEETATIEPLPDGRGVNLTAANGAEIHVDEEVAKQYPVALAVIPKVVDQKEFHALKVLQAVGKIKFQDATPGDGRFVLLLGKKGLKVEIKYDKSAKKFEFADPAQEAQLLKKGSGFGEEIKEALRDDARLNAVMESWRQLIDNTPESYFIHFFQNVPDWFTRATLNQPLRGVDLKDFTGSVPKNYTKGLIETQREVILSKLSASIDDASSLEDVSDKIGRIFAPAVMDFERQRDKFSSLNTKNYKEGENFSEEAFNDTVLRGISEVGIQSNDYKSWYKQFVDEMFLRHGMDDLRKGNAIKARDIINVFVHYTAVLDDPSIDGARSNISITAAMHNNIQKVNAALDKLGASATDTAIETETGIPAAEIPLIKDTAKELEKAEKYNLYSQYADYVAGQIYIKINEGALKDRTTVPNPYSGFWDTETFDTWKNHPRASTHEFIDRREIMKMQRDYITFDQYLALSDAQKATIPEDSIILPRKTCDLVFKSNRDLHLFWRIVGANDMTDFSSLSFEARFEKLRRTGTEEAFYQRMKEALDKLETKYKAKPGAFDILRKDYMVVYDMADDPSATASTVGTKFTFKPTDLSEEVDRIEKNLKLNKTVTRGDQELLINNAIARIIERTVLNNDNFDTYFNRDNIPQKVSEIWKDFKAWLFGP